MASDFSISFDEIAGAEPTEKPSMPEPKSDEIEGLDFRGMIDGILEAPLQERYVPTGEIDQRSYEPIVKRSKDDQPRTSFGALFKAGWVDDPKVQSKIYAASRFPDEPKSVREGRYRVYDGKIVYLGDDGRYHTELGGYHLDRLKAAAGTSIAAAPGAILSAVGALAGPLGAGLGAVGGEGIRKAVGSAAFGEQREVKDDMVDFAKTFALSMAAERVGRAITGATNAVKLRRGGGILKKAIKSDIRRNILTPEEQAKGVLIQTLAEKHGVKLAPHQIYEKEGLANMWKYLRKHPQTADAIQRFERQMDEQVETAILKGADEFSGGQDLFFTGKRVADTAKERLADAYKTRTAAVSPIYKKAFSETPEVDISGPLSEIDALIGKAPQGPAKSTLQKVKSFFIDKPEASKQAEVFKLVKDKMSAAGIFDKKVIREAQEKAFADYMSAKQPITSLEKIDWAKKQTDKYLKNFRDPDIASTDKETLASIQSIKEKILARVDEQAPTYAKARQTYEKLTPRVQRIKNSVIGQIARAETDDQMVAAAGKLFQPRMSPKLISEARSQFDDETWKMAVGSHIRDTYQKLKATEGGNVVNAAGKMQKLLFGSKYQRDQMQAAMDPAAFKNFSGLMEVMRKAAYGKGSESMTAPFQAIDKQLSKSIMSPAERLSQQPVLSVMREKAFDTWNDLTLSGNQQKLLDALMDNQATRQIEKMQLLKPNTEKGIRAMTVFMAWLAKRVYDTSAISGDQAPEAPQLPGSQEQPLPGR